MYIDASPLFLLQIDYASTDIIPLIFGFLWEVNLTNRTLDTYEFVLAKKSTNKNKNLLMWGSDLRSNIYRVFCGTSYGLRSIRTAVEGIKKIIKLTLNSGDGFSIKIYRSRSLVDFKYTRFKSVSRLWNEMLKLKRVINAFNISTKLEQHENSNASVTSLLLRVRFMLRITITMDNNWVYVLL